MITVGTMQLHTVEAADPMEPYFVGGEHTVDMTRISSHDHSGGLLGAPVAVTIPDGSITTADLDPSVLAPYALTDGSKPFTGEVTVGADAVVRDALRFGEQGTALTPDATLARTASGRLRADTYLGVGVTPAVPWAATYRALQVGAGAQLWAPATGAAHYLSSNTVFDGSARTALVTGAGTELAAESGQLLLKTAPSVAAGLPQTFTTRALVATTGTVTLTPDAGVYSLVCSGGAGVRLEAAGAIQASAELRLHPGSGGVTPLIDNSAPSGDGTHRWTVMHAVAGAINTSTAEAKAGLTPLDPLACYQAAKDVAWYDFRYLPPPYQEPPEQEGESPAAREARLDESQAAYARTVVETAPSRHQRGFVYPSGSDPRDEAGDPLPPVPDLFGLDDRESTTPGADLATLGCAMQEVIRRLELLEGAA